jgi:hypothetical protein
VKIERQKDQGESPFYKLMIPFSPVSALPSSGRADLNRLNNARAEGRAIVNGFAAQIKQFSRQAATATLDPLQQSLVGTTLAQIELALQQAIDGTLTDVNLLQLLTDVASTLIVPTTTTTMRYVK